MGCAITGSRLEGLNWIDNLSELVAVDSEFIEQKTDKGPNQFDKCFDRLESYRHANLRGKDRVEILLAGWDATKKRRFVHMHNAGYVEKVDAWWIGTGGTYAMTSLHS
ncbi:hypothetical protein MKW94_005738, partial [Papaver nudicaule]|nr:hypothetical protein [Papaver nudicaule]